jgi:tetratricopeptide (TPR) repeat protein
MSDWFRKVSWTPSDQEDFWTRHKRARAGNKSQYLRIQAVHLAGTNKPELRRAALGLLNLLIAEFPDRVQLSFAYTQRAHIHFAEGKIEEAIISFRQAISQEREFPNAKGDAWLDFGWLAVTNGRQDLFDEVWSILNERASDAFFPVHHFRMNAIRSIIAAERGDSEDARSFAATAMQHASKSHSGLHYHPAIGLVTEMRGPVLDRLREIQNG